MKSVAGAKAKRRQCRSRCPTRHSWKFFRACGSDQVLLESGEDVLTLTTPDQKLWPALSCPCAGLKAGQKKEEGGGKVVLLLLLLALLVVAKLQWLQ